MRFLKSSPFLVAGAMFLFSACNGGKDPSETAAKMIPKSAAAVISVDLGKLAQNNLTITKVSSWAKEDEIKQKAIASGIDTASRAFLFYSLAEGGLDQGMGGVLFQVADFEKFKTYLSSEGETVEENGVVFLGNEHYFAASNGTYGMFIAGHPSYDLKAEGLTLFALPKENSVLGDEKNGFASQQAAGYDAALWINGYEFSKVSAQEEEIALAMSTLHLNEYYSSSTLTFEKGEVVIDGATVGSDAFNETYKSFVPGSGVGSGTSEAINGENISGYAGVKVDLNSLEKVAAIGEFKPMIENALEQMGLELSDVLGALSGDFAVSFNGVVEVEQEKVDHYAYLYDETIDENAEPEVKLVKEQMPDFTFAMGVADREKLEKLLNLALMASRGDIEKSEDGVFSNKESGLTYFEKNGNLILAFAPTKDKILKGEVIAPGSDVIGNMSSYPVYYSFNLEKFMDQLSAASPEAAMGIGMGRPYIPFKEIVGYNTSDNNFSSKITIKMIDPEVNSLVQIVDKVDKFMNGFGQMMKGMM